MKFFGALLLFTLALGAQNINSVGGNSSWGLIYNIARDAQGNFYAADYTGNAVYKIDPLGAITTFAGTGRAGFAGDGGPATAALLNDPLGVAVCPDGNVYITDYSNDRIRRVAPNGAITTIAGSTGGFTGDGGPATAARLNGPFSIVCDAGNNLFFVDYLNYRIRRISAAGIISTVAGTGRTSQSGDGGLAAGSDIIAGWLAVAADGTIYFTDDGGTTLPGYKRVRKISNGIVTTVAGTGVSAYSGDGGPATAAQLRSASGVAVDRNGNIFIADSRDSRIRKVTPAGVISTYAGTGTAGNTGDGGPALQARLNAPSGMVTDDAGNLYFIEINNDRIRRVAAPPIPQLRTDSAVLTSFGGKAGFSSNTYVEIYGTNLSTESRLWAGGDFNGVNAPTTLDGVSVTINGKPAFIYYISPNQINVNTPEDTATGPVQVQVRTPFGLSNSITVPRSRLSPTLQTVPQFLINGKQHVVALTPDFSTYIGHVGMIPGVAFQPAKPGDTISIYALGCGPTTPPTQAGVVAAQGSALMLPYTLQIGGATAQVTFAGVVGATIGLYQFNVVVPAIPPGEHPITLSVDGVPNNQNLTIVVGQ
jgi:serine/threonine-protein kinase